MQLPRTSSHSLRLGKTPALAAAAQYAYGDESPVEESSPESPAYHGAVGGAVSTAGGSSSKQHTAQRVQPSRHSYSKIDAAKAQLSPVGEEASHHQHHQYQQHYHHQQQEEEQQQQAGHRSSSSLMDELQDRMSSLLSDCRQYNSDLAHRDHVREMQKEHEARQRVDHAANGHQQQQQQQQQRSPRASFSANRGIAPQPLTQSSTSTGARDGLLRTPTKSPSPHQFGQVGRSQSPGLGVEADRPGRTHFYPLCTAVPHISDPPEARLPSSKDQPATVTWSPSMTCGAPCMDPCEFPEPQVCHMYGMPFYLPYSVPIPSREHIHRALDCGHYTHTRVATRDWERTLRRRAGGMPA